VVNAVDDEERTRAGGRVLADAPIAFGFAGGGGVAVRPESLVEARMTTDLERRWPDRLDSWTSKMVGGVQTVVTSTVGQVATTGFGLAGQAASTTLDLAEQAATTVQAVWRGFSLRRVSPGGAEGAGRGCARGVSTCAPRGQAAP